jgi:hypothetical protein
MMRPLRPALAQVRLRVFFVLLVLGGSAAGQEASAIDLIRFLTYKVERPHRDNVRMGLFSCGQQTADWQAAKSLAQLGTAAIPYIEQELDVLEKAEKDFYGARWLQIAYARVMGVGAYPRLRRIESRRLAGGVRRNLDDAIALSLGLTSYVSDSRSATRSIQCGRGSEPRDPLDQVILGFEKDDRPWLEAALGPRARAGLAALLAQKDWRMMRTEVLRAAPTGGIAIGYRFETPGRWSEPVETLQDVGESSDTYGNGGDIRFELQTLFTNRSGDRCGVARLTFSRTKSISGSDYYLLDDDKIASLFRIIAVCAAHRP